MKVRFRALTDAARAGRYLQPREPAAIFDTDDGPREVLAHACHPFKDLRLLIWPPRLRTRALEALLAPATEAPEDGDGRIDPSRRFGAEPDRDEPHWQVRGFRHLETVDLKLLKHVLGLGERDPQRARAWWADRLGVAYDAEAILRRLASEARLDLDRFRAFVDDDLPDPTAVYRGASRPQRAAALEIPSDLRERFMRATARTVADTGRLAEARHIHFEGSPQHKMVFLDDVGTYVVAKGPREKLAMATGYCALAPGEARVGPATLRARWLRQLKDIRNDPTSVRIHSPLRWSSPPRS